MTGDDEEEEVVAPDQEQGLDQGQLVLAEAAVVAPGRRSRAGSAAKSLPYEGADATSKNLTTTTVSTGKDAKVQQYTETHSMIFY